MMYGYTGGCMYVFFEREIHVYSTCQSRHTFFALVPTKCTIALRGFEALASDHFAQSFKPNRSLNPPSFASHLMMFDDVNQSDIIGG